MTSGREACTCTTTKRQRAGHPTKLVRDAGVDSFDEPPDAAPTHAAVRIEHPEAQHAGDLQRADSAESGEPYESIDAADRASEVVTEASLD